jgi:transcriptional regulatory protein RtcR
MSKPVHLIGVLGSKLDAGRSQDRWSRWRPSVAACQYEDLLISRFELLHEPRNRDMAELVASDIHSVSPETIVILHSVAFQDPWDFEEVFSGLHEFARAYPFDTDQNEYLIHITTGSHVQQICLFLLAESRHLPGRLLQTSPPPREGMPGSAFRIIDLDLSRYDALASRFAQEQQEGLTFLKSGIETRNSVFNRLIEQIEKVAIASRCPMLITGPTGAGKTHLARRIFELKRRREQLTGSFVEINCATLRGDQAMSTLFGHMKGAFTGATVNRPGLLMSADRGLLFLDEIGELGLDEQAMLLRAIEEKRFLPVGADHEVQSDFQLLAGTNRNLQEAVQKGRFREDLLARINLWTFELPGLAARREDLEPNLDFELQKITDETGHRVSMSREARSAFLKWAQSPDAKWTANFRDLNAAVVRMATLAAAGRISESDVRQECERLKRLWQPQETKDHSISEDALKQVLSIEKIEQLDLFDRVQLAAVLTVCRECRSMAEAGRRLFAISRQSRTSHNDSDRLKKYLTRFGLGWDDIHFEPDSPS